MATNGLLNNVVRKLNSFFHVQQYPYTSCVSSCKQPCCVRKWDITEITCEEQRSQVKYAVLILNRPITQTQDFFINFWNSATVRMTIDGGTNQWDSFINSLSEDIQKTMKLPDLITGDFDSIAKDILCKYKQKGCKPIHTPDQQYTDFTKALMELNTLCQQQELELDNIVAIAQNSGRIDQIIANIQALFLAKEKQLLPNSRLYFASDDCISWLLAPGHHEIKIPADSRSHKRAWCSLVPVGEPCLSVTSSGLKWDLDDQPLKFGELISTSNTFTESEIVTVTCSHPLLWSMKVPCLTGS